jgi:hypothetical protein
LAFEQKPGYGALFKNTRKTKPNHPDYEGSINVDGMQVKLTGWIKQGKNGNFLSLSVKVDEKALARIGGDEEPF